MNSAVVASVAAGAIEPHHLELDAVEIIPAGKRSLLRITLDGDGPRGSGPDLDQITKASKAISRALDEHPEIGPEPYTLEVSSRGVHRPLTKPEHYRRNLTRLLNVRLLPGTGVESWDAAADRWMPAGASEPLAGRLVAAGPEDFILQAGQRFRVRIADVREALVQIELNRPATTPGGAEEEGA